MKIYFFFSLLLVGSLVLAGCDYGKQTKLEGTNSEESIPNQEDVIEKDKGGAEGTEENADNKVKTSVTIEEGFKEANVTVRPNSAQTQWTVSLEGNEIGKIPASSSEPDAFIEVAKYAQRRNRIYLGVTPSGIGGYILYSGPRELYVLDVERGTLELFLDLSGKTNTVYGMVTDISKDETKIAYIRWEAGGAVVNVLDIKVGETRQYMVDKEYHVAGDAKFSPDGSQLAYAAAIGDSSAEEGVVMIIQLESGEQKELDRIQGDAFRVEGWVEGHDGLIYRQL